MKRPRTNFFTILCNMTPERPKGLWTHKHGSSQTAPYWVLSSECVVVFVGNYKVVTLILRDSPPSRHAPEVL